MRLSLGLVLAVVIGIAAPAAAQQQPAAAKRERQAAVLRNPAPNLYFLFDFESSNAGFLVTDDGVLVIDTRQHPRDGQDLLDHIRKITQKPIKWVVNTHFHGDHNYGNSVFKAQGATIISQQETARLMQQVASKEFARRQEFFKTRGYDPNDVKLVLPDITFDHEATIRLGGHEIKLVYLGPGQNPGDTFVVFPDLRMVYTPGAFGQHTLPNMAFTPSVESWIEVLDQLAKMDVDTILPAHGDLAKRADVKEMQDMLRDEYAIVKETALKGVPLDVALKTVTLDQYKDWRNYFRREAEIKAMYELIQTGKRSYFETP
jgi:glyoxylase-like metal-dependent hydrolase (beta-lactamase superfamily II)